MRGLSAVRLKTAILLPLAVSLALLVAVVTYSLAEQEQNYTDEYVGNTFLSARKLFELAINTETEKLSAALELVKRDQGLRHAMAAINRADLLQRSAPVFERLRQEYGISHFYFIGPDRINILRVHQPDRFGDKIDRITTRQAEATHQPASGLELGPLGTFTLRVVHPWYEGTRLIGYLELGTEIEHLLQRVNQVAGVDLYVAIDKQYLAQEDWLAGMRLLGRQGSWQQLPDSVITFHNTPVIAPPILRFLGHNHRHNPVISDLTFADTTFKAMPIALRDAGEREVGTLLLTKDITAVLERQEHHTQLVAGFGLLVGGSLFGLFFLITGREEERMAAASSSLLKSEARFRSLVESSSDWIWEVDAEGRYVYASPKIKELLGYEPEEVLGKTPFDFMPPDEAARMAQVFAGIATERRPFSALENRNLHKHGQVVVLETSGVPILDEHGTLRGFRGVDRDITLRKRAETDLQEAHQRLHLYFQQTPLAVIEWDTDFKVVDWNPAAETAFGYSKAQVQGRHAMDLLVPESAKAQVEQVWHALLAGQGGFRSTNENITRDGATILCEWYNTPLVDAHGQVIGVTSLMQDVTKQKEAEKRLNFLAYFDALTGFPNRALFADRLSQAIATAERNKRLVGVMCVDLDHFKHANDTMGHAVGDVLLRAVANRLKSCLRESDTVARLGGDEFAIMLPGMSKVDEATQVAQKILDACGAPYAIADNEIFITFSIGITVYPMDDRDAQTLLRNADAAMHQAKAMGRDNFQFYSAQMTARVQDRLALEADLRHALERNEFALHYQPQIDLASGKTIGMEALIRWQHPTRGMVAPAEFIPVAEDSGLIVAIGAWVLRTACAQTKVWQDQGFPLLLVAVNLSARQFQQGQIVELVQDVLEETGLSPRFLELEITESLLMGGTESQVLASLQALKKLGVTLSIDDFGTGYSSLSYLKHFPIDKLKIDQSFVREVTSDPESAALVKAIIAMGHSLRLTVIAEGVETEEQLDFLRQHGCDQKQGYFFSRPLPADAFSELMASGKSLPPIAPRDNPVGLINRL